MNSCAYQFCGSETTLPVIMDFFNILKLFFDLSRLQVWEGLRCSCVHLP